MRQLINNISRKIMQDRLINQHTTPSLHRLIISSSHHLIIIVFSFLLFSCKNSNTDLSVSDIKNPATAHGINQHQKENMPEIQFDEISYNFGKVIQGEILSYTFRFKNSGKSSLIIAEIEASCGCTTSIPPKAPVKPGEKGEITITFDSKYKQGDVISYLMVTANTYPANTVLAVQANVVIP